MKYLYLLNGASFAACALLALVAPGRATDFFGIPIEGERSVPAYASPSAPGSRLPASRPVAPGIPLAKQATSLATFGGIPWGASMAEAQRLVKNWGDVRQTEMTPGKRVAFKGGTFGGHPMGDWAMEFQADKLYRGAIFLEKQGLAKEQFAQVAKLLLEKYGAYTSQDGDARQVIYEWKFEASAADPHEKRLRCALVPDQWRVKLVFIDDTIRTALGVAE